MSDDPTREQKNPPLLGLFTPPTPPPPRQPDSAESENRKNSKRNNLGSRQSFSQTSTTTDASSSGLLAESPPVAQEWSPLLHSSSTNTAGTTTNSFSRILPTDITPKTGHGSRKSSPTQSPLTSSTTSDSTTKQRLAHARVNSALPSIQEIHLNDATATATPNATSSDWNPFSNWRRTRVSTTTTHWPNKAKQAFTNIRSELSQPATWIGATVFLLYQVVFCLTMGSAIQRQSTSLLGAVAKMAALGVMMGGPVMWWGLGQFPALYPTVDLFAAPFYAEIALILDDAIHQDETVVDEDGVFLATFSFQVGLALSISGFLLILSSVFKLANLGAFLPYPVLCGFFAASGVMMWNLAFSIDTNGQSLRNVLGSGDWDIIQNAILHHVPTLLIGATMKYLGPKNPVFVVGVVIGTVILFYVAMLLSGTTREALTEEKWFWSAEDLVYDTSTAVGFARWEPPAPVGWINSMFHGQVHWTAVVRALDPTIALGFLYLIRSSLHGAALKKNVPNLGRIETTVQPSDSGASPTLRHRPHRRTFSEVLDIESFGPTSEVAMSTTTTNVVRPRPVNTSLTEILLWYGYTQFACAFFGGCGIVPSVAASPTMYLLKAEKLAPQILSVVLLAVFYITDFALVGIIPKPAFSSLLVLSFLDLEVTWFIKSFSKTKQKIEWLVVPLIVIFAFVVGLLSAVFLGIAMSSFFFVASFHRSGVVKYIANGIAIRSTIERPFKTAEWLDQNGDLVQVIVLQNYLFFANATSVLSYVSSMFDEPVEIDEVLLVPMPSVVILDLTLVTGIDTSAADVFYDILNIIGKHNCRLFVSGLSTNLKQVLALAGVKPETGKDRKRRKLRFFSSLDVAIGKAEDMLLDEAGIEDQDPPHGLHGFPLALHLMDDQHKTDFAESLAGLQQYTSALTMEPGENLYDDRPLDRGLFFIEQGIMKIEHSSNYTLSRVGSNELSRSMGNNNSNNGTIGQLNARSSSIGREIARLKAAGFDHRNQTFREARVGPGWVIGSMEALGGTPHPGSTVAVTNCRLHYLSYKSIEELESTDALLVLRLHKLLAYLMAKRQSVTISQLATLHSIMESPAYKKPLGRTTRSSAYG